MNWKRYILLPLALFLTKASTSQAASYDQPQGSTQYYRTGRRKKPQTWFGFDTFYLIPLGICIVLVSFGIFSFITEDLSDPEVDSTFQFCEDGIFIRQKDEIEHVTPATFPPETKCIICYDEKPTETIIHSTNCCKQVTW